MGKAFHWKCAIDEIRYVISSHVTVSDIRGRIEATEVWIQRINLITISAIWILQSAYYSSVNSFERKSREFALIDEVSNSDRMTRRGCTSEGNYVRDSIEFPKEHTLFWTMVSSFLVSRAGSWRRTSYVWPIVSTRGVQPAASSCGMVVYQASGMIYQVICMGIILRALRLGIKTDDRWIFRALVTYYPSHDAIIYSQTHSVVLYRNHPVSDAR